MQTKKKARLDTLLVEKGLAETRHQAVGLILSEKVKTDGHVQTKPGALVLREALLEVLEPPPYVGRGGFKLEKALQQFQISAKNKTCMDIGASTGGFTDCLLQQGANKVYAVDVGRGQLAWKLRQDPKVICLEKLNARYLTTNDIPELIDLCTMDVSFISVTKILPAVKTVMFLEGQLVLLIKPQFEAGRHVVKKGLVQDKKVHQETIEKLVEWCENNEFFPQNLTFSPITGGDGNIEFLLQLALTSPSKRLDAKKVVDAAHSVFSRESS